MNQTTRDEISNWRWLTSEQGRELVKQLEEMRNDPLRMGKWMRKKNVPRQQAHLVIDQWTLQPKAQEKFAKAKKMFFEAQLLQQATSESLACWKARRFTGAESIVDICCGLGGDLLALGELFPNATVTGIDRSEIACHLARVNCDAMGVDTTVICNTAESFMFDLENQNAWFHIDPDRRPEGNRTTMVELFSPPLGSLQKIIDSQKNGAVKLAPASQVPENWNDLCERQWIGDARECKQLVAWFGATTRHAGLRSAAAVDSKGATIFEWVEVTRSDCQLAKQWGPYLFEPHPTLIAGRMVESLAAKFALQKAAEDVAYLTGEWVDFAGFAAFEILEVTKMDELAVVESLLRLNCSGMETKKRGLDHEMVDQFSKVVNSRLKKRTSKQSDPNEQFLVLFLTRLGSDYSAVIARRINR